MLRDQRTEVPWMVRFTPRVAAALLRRKHAIEPGSRNGIHAVARTEQRTDDRAIRVGIPTAARGVDDSIAPTHRVRGVPVREAKRDAHETSSRWMWTSP